MPALLSRARRDVLYASVETVLAGMGAGLVLLVFYPLTLCVAGAKGLVRAARLSSVGYPRSAR